MRGLTLSLNPWKTKSSSYIYRNEWFSVREDQVIRPDGEPGTYSVVVAERLAIGIVPLWEDGSITLVGQHRYPLDEYSWEIPSGGGQFDVESIEGAKRELLEETGITAKTWENLGRLHTSNCFNDEVCHLYLATDLNQGDPDPDPDEILESKKVSFEKAIKMVMDGVITDAVSVAGIFQVMLKNMPISSK